MDETLRGILRELYRLSTLCDQQAAALREKEAEVTRLKAAVLPPIDPAFKPTVAVIERTRE